MHTVTDARDRRRPTRVMSVVVGFLALVLANVYYFSFYGSEVVETRRNSIAFADTGEYVALLRGHHYFTCLGTAHVDRVEHRRKTIHHVDYLILADLVVGVVTGVGGLDEVSAIWLPTPLLGAINFVLAFFCFRRECASELALPAALAYAVVPATWIYAAVPETWIFWAPRCSPSCYSGADACPNGSSR